MIQNPLVSILITAYKFDFYYDCLLSALNQSYPNIEIIICDDSPFDKIEKITNSFKEHKNFNKIKYIKNEVNLGERKNVQKCFELSKGEYIKFLNDDDLLYETCVEKMIYYFMKYENKISLVTSKRQLINQNGEFLADIFSTRAPNIKKSDDYHSYINGILLGNLVMETTTNFIGEPTTVMFPRKLLETNKPNIYCLNGKDIYGNGDLSMWFNLLYQGDAVYIYEPLSCFRLHLDQNQLSVSTKYECITHWYYLLFETLIMGFLKNKQTYYTSIKKVYFMLLPETNSAYFSQSQRNTLIELCGNLYELILSRENIFYYCPVCKSYFENFVKYKGIHKLSDFETINIDKYSCPNCFSSDRDRLYALYIEMKINELDKSTYYKIIDFSPTFSLSNFIKSKNIFSYRSADLFMENVDDKVDITDLSIYSDSSIDCFICSNILEHILDDKKALSELYRILKVNTGWGILVVPSLYDDSTKVTPEERINHLAQEDYVGVYSKTGFEERVKEVGFNITELDKNYFGIDTFNKCGITEKIVLYIVKKNVNLEVEYSNVNSYLENKDYKQAETILYNLISLDPNNVNYLYKLGLVQAQLKHYEKAIDTISECIELGIITYDSINTLAFCLEKIGDTETSEIYYQKLKEFI